jgi:serine/threonine-protein kinase SRPK3
LSLADK